ncbi:MAG: hypothetical protein IKC59_02255 [Clostridia bacterium]|nr:hypothetical protein [Clostridia bacterium]
MNQTQRPSGFVRRFCDYNAAQMAKLKSDLALQMSHASLNLCADYFRAVEGKRDPSIAELRFLDAIAALPPRAEEITLSELYTNDSFVALTYADMMNKRRELHPDAEVPISLGEALGLASAYLKRSGKETDLIGSAPVFCEADAITRGAVCAEGASVALDTSGSTVSAFSEGDLFMLIHRGSTPTWKYGSKIDAFLSDEDVIPAVKASFTVPEEGLLYKLLPICDGICYNLPALSPDGHSVTPMLLLEKFSEYRVVALQKSYADAVAKVAVRMGLRPMIFAAVVKDKKTHLLYSSTEITAYDTAFLRRLSAMQTAIAKLPNEQDAPMAEITHTPVGLHQCSYLTGKPSPQLANGTLAVARGVLLGSPYRSAMETALTVLLSTAASGCKPSESSFAVSLRTPPLSDSEKIGEAVAAILGIYRLQCELSISSEITEIVTDPSLDRPEVNLFSISPKPLLPSEFTKKGNRLYCVAPALGKDGLVDFDALRALLKELDEFCRQGDIQSVRILCAERITDAITQMETDALTSHLTDADALVGDRLPLAILFEATALLPYPVIGYVTEKEAPTTEPSIIQLPKLSSTLNRTDRYCVVLIAKSADRNAIALSKIIRDHGADCVRLCDSVPEFVLCRELLAAQLVILCGAVALPNGDQLSFARRVLKEAGGTVIQLGENGNLPQNFADHVLPNGICESNFTQIAGETDGFESFS